MSAVKLALAWEGAGGMGRCLMERESKLELDFLFGVWNVEVLCSCRPIFHLEKLVM